MESSVSTGEEVSRARSGLFAQMKSEVFRVVGKLVLPALHPIGLD
jgi:hypothetical protein